ncbi:nucleotidyltransferase family protein [Janibacter cremeus]|uniref:Molybdenum cofactor cytidylyltransferase/nicotine blue oxidoreductase n=1 Tax=Janibacter cremeus TaxID=1285192 RepID=A0A852VU11_9MICO|nr:nucleotidyltransferase family protein [Janibacter cremeus]NYF98163.1 molybdenum cofactor cytidylyltransferase/nicotine blue oxidoreductase [Janibacter cremeus]
MANVSGLVLAAGAGRRMGAPKALMTDPDGTSWLARSLGVLRNGGCDDVTVVLGACGGRGAELVPGVPHLIFPGWDEGIGASLAHGLRHLGARPDVDAVLVHLVDLPDVTADIPRRLLAKGAGPATLSRAVYDGVPGHPALIGRDHWAPLVAQLAGDRGANAYLRRHGAQEVECSDLASGLDVDFPEAEGGRTR